jgi:phage gpG-like protein
VRFRIEFSKEQMNYLLGKMTEFEERAADMSPPLREATTLFLQSQGELWSGHEGWPALTKLSAERKTAGGFPELMVKTGELRNSLTGRRGTKFASTFNTKTYAVMGTNDPVGRLHIRGSYITGERFQKTTGKSTGVLPQRPIAWIDAVMVETFFQLLQDYLANGIGGAGGVDEETPASVGSHSATAAARRRHENVFRQRAAKRRAEASS